jgi:hypothetical protein
MALTKKYDWEKRLQARELKESEWRPFKQEIKTLYLTEGIPLQDLRELMYDRWGFYATYESTSALFIKLYSQRTIGSRSTKNVSARSGTFRKTFQPIK